MLTDEKKKKKNKNKFDLVVRYSVITFSSGIGISAYSEHLASGFNVRVVT